MSFETSWPADESPRQRNQSEQNAQRCVLACTNSTQISQLDWPQRHQHEFNKTTTSTPSAWSIMIMHIKMPPPLPLGRTSLCEILVRLGSKQSRGLSCNVTLLLALLSCIIQISSSQIGSNQQQTVDKDINPTALRNKYLPIRYKRQQPATGGPSNGTPQSSGQGDDPNSQNNGSPQDERPPDETLSSFKCDFGSADSPDTCKFKILDPPNTIGKSLSTWTHGSGKLALFQGGPLIDASDRNDTLGGYMFYETSNPFAPNQTRGTGNPSSWSSISGYDSPTDHQATTSTTTTTLFSSRPTSSLLIHQHHKQPPGGSNLNSRASDNNNNNNNRNIITNDSSGPFQHLTSGRVSVSASHQFGPSLVSPNLTAPGPTSMCLSFKYAIHGLSAEELRVLVLDQKTEHTRPLWSSFESAPGGNWSRAEVLYSATNNHALLFTGSGPNSPSLTREPQQRRFRGYLAVDEIEVNKHESGGESSDCRGHCTFDGDLCGWTNAEGDGEDDFDWSFGRGSDNLFTGPPRDFVSSTNNDLTGSYLFTDSGYPRRPGDRALLVSPLFPATAVNEAQCMRLAVHMFGSGIGSLAIRVRQTDDQASSAPNSAGSGQNSNQATGSGAQTGSDGTSSSLQSTSGNGQQANKGTVVWEMFGDSGNSWHQAQTSVSSSRSPYQVIIEGVVGENHLGQIAIDEISFSPGPCPTSPPIASKNYGDCTFEQTMCYWRNPDAEIHLDDLDWIRWSAEEQTIHGPHFDHTLKRRSGSYLKLEHTLREPKSGSRAFLLSPIFEPRTSVQCLSFYYYMFMRSVGPSGPNLGTIRVYLASNNELTPIWRLTNPISSPVWKQGRVSLSTVSVDGEAQPPRKLFQIAFEGIWGDAPGGSIAIDDVTIFEGACDIQPSQAKSVPGECTFDVDLCSWTNKTLAKGVGSTGSSANQRLQDSLNGATDAARSPFLQSVGGAGSNVVASVPGVASGHSTGSGINQNNLQSLARNHRQTGWQLATVDARPVNLQDHTYKAPIGYIYVDAADGLSTGASGLDSPNQLAHQLQAAEVVVQPGQQVQRCLSFWFAAFGRREPNQLSVFMSQASAPPPEIEGGVSDSATSGQAASPQSGGQPGGGSATGLPDSGEASSSDGSSSRWSQFKGKMLLRIGLLNVTESQRRKWHYAQVAFRADSNYLVRFDATATDGGFALDDISFYEGGCGTRPSWAQVRTQEEEEEANASGGSGSGGSTAAGNGSGSGAVASSGPGAQSGGGAGGVGGSTSGNSNSGSANSAQNTPTRT